ncbi:MAG: glycosyltransferase [Anaerolineales bacterium]|nr:glycosyltransferase [Anaerolineales bacterium]
MKILVLNYEYPPVGGGGGRACADLCGALVRRGHEIHLLTSHYRHLPRKEMVDGYTVHRIPCGRNSITRASFFSMAWFITAAYLPGMSLLRTWDPDVLHVHFAVPTGVLARRLSRRGHIPYVLTAHLGDVPGGVPQKTDRWFRFVYPFTHSIWKDASTVIAVSEFTKDLALKHYEVPIRVIPNGVELAEKSDSYEEVPIGEPPQIIFAGRFQPQKNLPFLVKSLDRIRDMQWQCLLLGDGPQWEEVKNEIHMRDLEERVRLGGWVSPEEVWDELGNSDILAMPSLSEGLPVVGVYALAQGLAIVANRAGGLGELVENGTNGRLCNVGDEDCFVEGLRWCLEDVERLRGLKKTSRAKAERYDIKKIAETYEAIFEEAVP